MHGNSIPTGTGGAPPAAATHPGKHHRWKAKEGEKRTIAVEYQPREAILRYLRDMREALTEALAHAYALAKISGFVPNLILLRRKVKPWVTLKPFTYEHITFTPSHKKWSECRKGKASEILLTERRFYMTFVLGSDGGKPLGARLLGSDLNFQSIDSTALSGGRLEPPHSEPLNRIMQVQSDFSRRRRRLQLNARNPRKRAAKLAETRGRQRNRVRDELHKLSAKIVIENPDTSLSSKT